ncbi:MAG: hypothetical protein QN188_09900 [Armatimonadota bacterium]|nr:hypothetical protein [Armatimonadota bacterium]MDR5688930.1 hypothetical protein [Armatimonadota bacterium]MDR7387554.1 hypothetical protein [Armatimonadota bacterium]MDR7389467.1 hypothetical protein [Armatimonadota bacterium]MDR7392509.1 hypothetical protein [Armatimonadota bacterium]
MTDAPAEVVQASEVVVLGGGCYGCFHARQLLRASERGRLRYQRLVVVDRNPQARARAELTGKAEVVTADWTAYLVDYVPAAPADAQLVPAPFAPHVLADWLVASLRRLRPQLRVSRHPLPGSYPVAYDVTLEDRRYLSEAAWRCPATCPEPQVCPATRGPRTWDLASTVERYADLPVLRFSCLHFAYGVGTIAVRSLQEALRWVADRATPGQRVGVLTASHCHGVGTCLVVEEA